RERVAQVFWVRSLLRRWIAHAHAHAHEDEDENGHEDDDEDEGEGEDVPLPVPVQSPVNANRERTFVRSLFAVDLGYSAGAGAGVVSGGMIGNLGVPASMRTRFWARPRRRLRMRRRALVMVVFDGILRLSGAGCSIRNGSIAASRS